MSVSIKGVRRATGSKWRGGASARDARQVAEFDFSGSAGIAAREIKILTMIP
jgi:hypothetical protein